MRAKPQVLGGIVGIAIVLVAVVVIGQGAPKNPSGADPYQETLNDLAATGNRTIPRPTTVSGLALTHASTLPGTLIYDYTFSAGANVDSAVVTSAVVTLTTQNCGKEAYQETIFNRGLTLRMNLLNSSGSLVLSRDLKKAGCPQSH
jgi:hypothetical protein